MGRVERQMSSRLNARAKKRPLSYYSRQIVGISGCTEDEARHVESRMRLQYGTLDHLDSKTFDKEVREGLAEVRTDPAEWEKCAESYGL